MDSIDIIKPLFTVPSSAVNKSQLYQEKNSCECQESNQGLLDENQVCFLCALQPPQVDEISTKDLEFWREKMFLDRDENLPA